MLGTISGALARSLICIYPITLNGYIYSPGKKIEKIKKNRKNLKKLKIIGTISGALARSLITSLSIRNGEFIGNVNWNQKYNISLYRTEKVNFESI